ncbi:MAG: hypothetical protein ACI8QT_000090 [Halioglobus sp.]|jgi:uncharacterized protein (TIGR02466 family)
MSDGRPQNSEQGKILRGAILHADFWSSTIPDCDDLNVRLLEEIRLHQEQESAAASGSNIGCWRGHRDYKNWPPIRDYVIHKLKLIHRHYANLGTSCSPLEGLPDDRFEFECWTNINEPGSINAIHSHAKWHWSGVYYVQAKDTGPIAFYSQPYLNQNLTLGLPFGQSFTVEPSDGQLLIFPSYLLHEVLQNTSDRQRINLGLNVRIDFEGKP